MKQAIQKFLINWYQASDKPLPKWLENACDSDDTLALERDLGKELTASLKQRPNGSSPIAGDSMAAKVMRQITEEDYLAEQKEQKTAWGGWVKSAGMAMAVVALVAVAIQFLGTNKQMPADETTVAQTTNSSPTINADAELLDISTDWKNPLDQEIEYIVSDAKGALGFLANSFVPSSLMKKPQDNKNA